MDPETERQLVHGLKAGDVVAFEAVYENYRPRLFSFLARLSRRRDVAEDLLEETWLRLVTTAPRLADDTCLAAWLFTVARNLHANWCRNRATDQARLADPVARWPQPAPGRTPFEMAAGEETMKRLERALARLGTDDREVLLLVGAHGLAPGEAAQVLGLSPATLRKRLQRARERLGREMDPETRAPVAPAVSRSER